MPRLWVSFGGVNAGPGSGTICRGGDSDGAITTYGLNIQERSATLLFILGWLNFVLQNFRVCETLRRIRGHVSPINIESVAPPSSSDVCFLDSWGRTFCAAQLHIRRDRFIGVELSDILRGR